MRRRIARHVERGTSDRVIACLIGPTGTEAGNLPAPGPEVAYVDLSNVILFRALGGKRAVPMARSG